MVVLVILLTACGVVPTGTYRVTGTFTSGTLASFQENDDAYYTTGAACNGFFGGCTTDWYASFRTAIADPSLRYRVDYVGKNAGAAFQFIYVWNWRTSSWFALDEYRVVATEEVSVSKSLPGANTDWVTPRGDAFVRVLTIGNFTSSSTDLLQGTVVSAS